MGVPFVEDFNDPKQPASSITKLRTTVDAQGKRSSTRDAFLSEKDVKTKRNLKICFGAVVQRIHLDDRNQVRGVFVEAETPSPETYYVGVEKEVIVCGGAVASPQLLALRLCLEMHPNYSGIGPKEQLAKLNITCTVDLAGVGSHLVTTLPSISNVRSKIMSPCHCATLFLSSHPFTSSSHLFSQR
jgi:choline dehydrogenase